jgi:SAM-dependent methyltransferase
MRNRTLKPLSARDYYRAFDKDWKDAKKSGRDPKPDLFLLFPMLEECIRGKRTLEIGCGFGTMVRLAKEASADASGIDLFREPQVEDVIKGDFMTAPLHGPYDFIFAFGVFERCALYSPACLEKGEFWRSMQERFPPPQMLARLRELLSNDGQCLFQTYLDPLIFTKEMARQEGFELSRYVRRIGTRSDFYHRMWLSRKYLRQDSNQAA